MCGQTPASPLGLRGPVANVRSPRLKRFEIRAGRNLPVQLLAGQPHFKVKGLRGRKPGIACAQEHAPVWQFQRFENLFGIAGQPLVLRVRLFRPRELDQFDLLKLVLANDAARILARAPPRRGNTACRP